MAFVLRSSRAIPVTPLSASRCPRALSTCQTLASEPPRKLRPEFDMAITHASGTPTSVTEVWDNSPFSAERELIKAKFRELHSNQDDFLYGYDELRTILQKGKPDLTENELQMLYSGIDKKTDDGKVSIEDFVEFIYSPTQVLSSGEATPACAISSSRGFLRDAASAKAWAAASPAASALNGRCLAYFNGAFSPPTRAHAHIIKTLLEDSGIEALWLDPEPSRPGKPRWLDETLEARVRMCDEVASVIGNSDGRAGVGTLRQDMGPELGGNVELFHTLRAMIGGPSRGRLLWVLGADVLEGMRYWAEKARSLVVPQSTCDGLVVFVRGGSSESQVRETATAVFGAELAGSEDFLKIIAMPSDLSDASSNRVRAALVAGANSATAETRATAEQEVQSLLMPEVRALCTSEVMDVYTQQVASTPRGAGKQGK